MEFFAILIAWGAVQFWGSAELFQRDSWVVQYRQLLKGFTSPALRLGLFVLVPVLLLALLLWLIAPLVFGLPLFLISVAVLLYSLLFELRMALRLGSKAVVKLRIAAGETLQFAMRDGQWHEGEVLGSTTVTSFLTVINLRVGSQRGIRSIVILPDSMAADDYRRLRVWLRWRPAAQAD